MPTRRDRAGFDGHTAAEIRGYVRDLTAAEKLHVKSCWACRKASRDTYARCDHGWELAKSLHHWRYLADKLNDPPTERMDPLW